MKINKELGERLKAQRLALLQERYFNIEMDIAAIDACMGEKDLDAGEPENYQKEITSKRRQQADIDRAYRAVKAITFDEEVTPCL